MMWNLKRFIVVITLLVQGGCVMQVYDEKNPDEYHSFWEEHRKDSVLYPYTGEYKEEKEGNRIP